MRDGRRFYQLPGLVAELQGPPRSTKKEYVTIRYLPATTYDGWPIRIEGPLESIVIKELNGGEMPPERETPAVKNMYGQAATGWYGAFSTSNESLAIALSLSLSVCVSTTTNLIDVFVQ
jgi:hypothetical protein